MKVYVIQNKNRILMNLGAIGVLAKMIICGILAHMIVKLVWECEDEILNTNESSIDDKKVTYGKNNCLIYTISLVIICLLLSVVICVSCYLYYTRDWIKKRTFSMMLIWNE